MDVFQGQGSAFCLGIVKLRLKLKPVSLPPIKSELPNTNGPQSGLCWSGILQASFLSTYSAINLIIKQNTSQTYLYLTWRLRLFVASERASPPPVPRVFCFISFSHFNICFIQIGTFQGTQLGLQEQGLLPLPPSLQMTLSKGHQITLASSQNLKEFFLVTQQNVKLNERNPKIFTRHIASEDCIFS